MRLTIFLSEAMVPLVMLYIVGFGLLLECPMLDDFIDGAKDDMKAVAGILPTPVGLMVSVGVLRASGLLNFLGKMPMVPAALIHLPPQIAPVILVCLASNSVVAGLVLDTSREFGTNSNIGPITFALVSSTETVLYCISVYFGSTGIRKTRYTLAGGLIVTTTGVAVSVALVGVVSG